MLRSQRSQGPRAAARRRSRLLSPARPSPFRLGLVLAVSALAFTLASASFLARWSARRGEDGIRWADTPAGIAAAEVEPSGPGEAAGVRPGDRLRALDGEPMGSSLEAEDRIWRSTPQQPLPLTLERDGVRRVVALLPAEHLEERYVYSYLAVVGLLGLVLGTLLVLRLPPGTSRLPYYLLSLTCFVLLAFSHSGRGGTLDWVVYWGDVCARTALPSVFLHFALSFTGPGRRPLRRAFGALLYLPAVTLAGLEAWLVAGRAVYRVVRPVETLETLHRLQLGWIAAGLLAGTVLFCVRYLRAADDRARRPLKWLLWGGAAGFGPLLVLQLAPAALGVSPPGWTELGVLPVVLVPLCFASAVARYRLTDLELFFRRGLAASAVAGCAAALCLGLLLSLRRLLPAAPAGLPVIAALAVTVSTLPWLRARLEVAVDRIFHRERYDHRRSLREFGRDLSRVRELEPLVRKLADRLVRTLDLERVAVLVADPQGRRCRVVQASEEVAGLELPLDSPLALSLARGPALDLHDLADPRAEAEDGARFEGLSLRYLLPLQVGDGLAGIVALGERRNRVPLNSEDLDLLEAVARHAAVAVEGARLFGELQHNLQEIADLKEFSEGILESSEVGVLVVGEDGRITGCNRALTRLIGMGREELLDRDLADAFGERFAGVLRSGIGDRRAGSSRRYRERLEARPGVRRVNLGFSPLRLAGGRRSWVITFDDVTEGIRHEEALIQQERLASIGLLASGVAHEVNTPLTGISSYAQMLLAETPADDPRRPLLHKIEQQSFRASDIANRLLNFSRPDARGLDELQPNALVEDTLSLFEPQIRGRRIFVRRELAPSLPPIRGHRGKLQQVLLNLLLNARDAMPRGGEVLLRTAGEGEEVLLEVQDDGEGIRPEVLDRIYDPFFTTKPAGAGTGLGLSITYGIIQEHAGTIHVDTEPGRGTRFQVRLPAVAAARAAAS